METTKKSVFNTNPWSQMLGLIRWHYTQFIQHIHIYDAVLSFKFNDWMEYQI